MNQMLYLGFKVYLKSSHITVNSWNNPKAIKTLIKKKVWKNQKENILWQLLLQKYRNYNP